MDSDSAQDAGADWPGGPADVWLQGAGDDGSLDRAALDAALIAAHEAGDQARLVSLDREAAGRAEAAGDTDGACFFLTHAYVFALASGAPEAGELHGRLLAHGREE